MASFYQPIAGPAQALKNAFQEVWGALRSSLGLSQTGFNFRGRTAPVPDSQWDYNTLALRQDRRAIIDDVKRQSLTDPRQSTVLEISASDATVGGWKLILKNSGSTADAMEIRADGILQRVVTKLKLVGQSEDLAKRLIRDGDLFGQVLLDERSGEVVGVQLLDAGVTFPCKTNRGQWQKGPEYAYYQTDGVSDQPVQWFAEWEIVHIKWGGGEADIVGQSQYRASRKSGHILEKAEEDLAIRRRIRTGLRFHHQAGNNWEEVEEYKKNIADTLKKPYDIRSDIITTSNCVVTPLPGDQGIGELADINLFIDNQFARARVPKALAGYETAISSDILEQQIKQYERYLDRVVGRLNEFFKGIFSRALLFAGINDEAIDYDLVWAPRTQESLDAKIARIHVLRMLGMISMETGLRLLDWPTVDWETEKIRIAQEMDDFVAPPFSIASGRPGLPATWAEVYSMYPWLAPPELQKKIMPPEPESTGDKSSSSSSNGKSSSSNGNGKARK